jgi:hypothetical protein
VAAEAHARHKRANPALRAPEPRERPGADERPAHQRAEHRHQHLVVHAVPWGGARITAFLLVLVAAALMPAPVRAGEALNEPGAERVGPSPSSA